MGQAIKQLAVVTGASTGIGYELAIQCAKHGFDLVVGDEGLDEVQRRRALADQILRFRRPELFDQLDVRETVAMTDHATRSARCALAGFRPASSARIHGNRTMSSFLMCANRSCAK